MEDVEQVALITGQAFGFNNFPGIDSDALKELEEKYAVAVQKEVNTKLAELLQRKLEAQKLHREYRLRKQAQAMRARLAAMRGERNVTFPGPDSPQDQRAVQKWLRTRMFNCILAVDPGSSEILGCVNISMMQPESLLPPPFPSSAPHRLYVSNMCVAGKHRRRGGAMELLRQCERLGRLWGQDSLWLHVSVMNVAAQALYQRAGFVVVDEGLGFTGPLRQILMKKDLAPWVFRRSLAEDEDSEAMALGGVAGRLQDGVFVWEEDAAGAAKR